MIMFYLCSIVLVGFSLYIYCLIFKYPKLASSFEQSGDTKLFDLAKRKDFTEIVYSALPFAVLLIVLKTFFVDVVTIPSGSMLPNFPIGSMAFINKTTFGVRSPLTGVSVTQGRYPKLGEAIISKFPLNPDVLYIKRVVGLPGDMVSLSNKALTINNVDYPLQLTDQMQVKIKDKQVLHDVYEIEIGSIKYRVIANVNKPFPVIMETVVTEDSFYLLGDNLTGSGDSRTYGSVPWSYLIGSIM